MGLPAHWPIFSEDHDFATVQTALIEASLSDGLPLVAPTQIRLDAMLSKAVVPDQLLGLMPPLTGELTPRAIAYNCVLAGCQPDALPVVITAAAACLDAQFNLLGLATTTGSPAVATIVHGPVSEELTINAGSNCLGPGTQANATIGRAISLVLRNIGGMRTGAGDMATLGQPGKYGICFAESQASPYEQVHSLRGIEPGNSAVTVLGVSGTIEVLPSQKDGNWDAPETILEPVAQIMQAAWCAGGGSRRPDQGDQVLLLPPELSDLLAARDWCLAKIQSYIFETATSISGTPIAASPKDILIIVTGGPGTKMCVLPLWGGGTRAITRELVRY